MIKTLIWIEDFERCKQRWNVMKRYEKVTSGCRYGSPFAGLVYLKLERFQNAIEAPWCWWQLLPLLLLFHDVVMVFLWHLWNARVCLCEIELRHEWNTSEQLKTKEKASKYRNRTVILHAASLILHVFTSFIIFLCCTFGHRQYEREGEIA